ncbi:DUF4349 domain-containing protein [Micromonospora auratinigra]|uniref:DUF4349 domain-containing protein n=1 Tax=Micromonospora auratinigra TaxID=261654 RepID=A0A1A9A6J3_9ACTN|nr:DUF4349 domain-containing protein [Micromonospora auratinigra]SBT51797.1 protein of unknown function (DUF4349) [Micromonospora auratinigra]
MSVRGRRVALVAAGLAALLGAGACSAGGDSGSESRPAADAGGRADAGAAGAPEQAAPAAGGAGGTDLRVDQRSIIYTGTIQVQVADVDRAAREATDRVRAAGGFVGGDRRSSASADARAELTLRVPADRFAGFVDELVGLGRQQRREIRTEDVTEQTVDLDARIATQKARVDSARRLLARATSISDLVTLENEVGRREADLASLEAKKRRLADLTALSTVTVTFVGPDVSTADEGTDLGFLVGLKGGWKVFVDVFFVALTVLGALLPFAVVIGVPTVLLVRALRRRRARRGPPAGPAPRVPGPTGPVGPLPSGPPPVPATRSAP